MTEYKNITSASRPDSFMSFGDSIWINSDITQVTMLIEGEKFSLWQFNQKCYAKDEYISELRKANENLEKQITEIQLALCDVYEDKTGGMN